MEHVVDNSLVPSRGSGGPLAPWIDAFSVWAGQQGYSRSSISRRVCLATGFNGWLEHEGIDPDDVTSDHPARYLQYRARRQRLYDGDAAALRHLIDFLRLEGVVPAEKTSADRKTEVERYVLDYERYLRESRGLATATILNYLPFVRAFLQYRFGNGQVTLLSLRAGDVEGFVVREASGLHRTCAKLMTTSLRSFLRYARHRSEGMADLTAAVPVVANWSMTSLPRAISADRVDRLFASINRSTAMGRRDCAILLLLARLGLRSSEVVFLELDDIDWHAGTLHAHMKGGVRKAFPLPHEVGKAIADYLRNGRPSSASRRVFLRSRAPTRGFRGAGAISSLVRHSLQRARGNAPTGGAHQFRHGLATEMMRGGASLGEIGDVLGHRHPDTTRIYAKVDIESLRALALPWPGGVR